MSNSKEFWSNYELLGSLEPGDIVEFPRGRWSHFGIYVGDGNVIHALSEDTPLTVFGKTLSCLSSNSSCTGMKLFAKGTVVQQSFFDIAQNVKAKKMNFLDDETKPLSPEKIVEKAKSKLNKNYGYDLIQKNCEHFATWCRYELGYSKQTNCFCIDSFSFSIQ